MAKRSKAKLSATAPSKNQFAESLFTIGSRFSLAKVFDDFLTMSIAACTINPLTKLSHYEEEYLDSIAHYKDSELRHEFPKAFAHLVMQMEERVTNSQGNDVLGDFFEHHLSNGRNGQYFTPFPICQFMALITRIDRTIDDEFKNDAPVRVIDPSCGSGRMLVASHRINKTGHEYYGIDIDRTCVKMAALNLFLSGMWNSEVMCGDSLRPDDFVISYRISFLPLGIFKVTEKEQSPLWHLHRNSFSKPETKKTGELITLDTTPFNERAKDNATQLDLF
jgi:type I restriction-modification system DNA methylase subunit